MNLKTPVKELAGVGEVTTRNLAKLGISSVQDILLYLPRRWDDFSKITAIKDVRPDEMVSIKGSVWQIQNRRTGRGMKLTEAIIGDRSGTLKAVWFNQPFIVNNIKAGDEVCLAGKVEWNYGTVTMTSPSYEKLTSENVEELTHTGRIVPVYPETDGISSKFLRSKIKPLIKLIYSIKDYLPQEIKEENNLIDLPAAIRQMHFPENSFQLKKARDRLDFDEMFLLQMTVLSARKKLKKEKSIAIPFDEPLIKNFVQSLDFDLTKAQRKATWEILQDLTKPMPMNRLLQGDVGSGKTIVAAMAMLNVASADSQSVLLCPTEVLAKQHYRKLEKLVSELEYHAVLLTGSTPKAEKEEILSKIREGEVKIIIGTHALLEKGVEFWRLGLAIVDEQHRFGVEQRQALRKESIASKTLPHFLSMTATPIPRTLSITLYGDLDVSILNEMPPGRTKILTKMVPAERREKSYSFIREQLKLGRQAFVVCPLIGEEETPEEERKAVMSEYNKLANEIFPDFKVASLHGKMKAEDKEEVMAKFTENKIQILVSTSVIEVGIDVPNATIMIIEDADRFGLAQLHQFRGRVGRGKIQSFCFLFTNSRNEQTLQRLFALENTSDGFKLAEADLEIRGPGDFIGKRQHGLSAIKMNSLTDTQLIKKCRDAAQKFLEKHDVEDYALLSEKMKAFDGILYLE
jgi:ATP-dependent DNA helicase RecG